MKKEDVYLLGLFAYRKKIELWLKESNEKTLLLDGEKASMLFPVLISSFFEEKLLSMTLGISAHLIQELKDELRN